KQAMQRFWQRLLPHRSGAVFQRRLLVRQLQELFECQTLPYESHPAPPGRSASYIILRRLERPACRAPANGCFGKAWYSPRKPIARRLAVQKSLAPLLLAGALLAAACAPAP